MIPLIKNKLVWFSVFALVLTGILWYQNVTSMRSKLTVESTNDKGIFVGEKQRLVDTNSDYARQVKAIDDASAYERAGNSYYQSGNFERAIEEYKKAYSIKGGLAHATAGFELAETFEKLGRYDEAISVLDDMIQKKYLSPLGIQDATQMKSRLLAAKDQANQTQ